MQPMKTLRDWQLNKMERTITIVHYMIDGIDDQDLRTWRDGAGEGGGDGWTVLEVLCHLNDYEALFTERARLTIETTYPDLVNPDPDELARVNKYNEQDVEAVITQWEARRRDFLKHLVDRPESDYERGANHPRRGPFSLNDQIFLAAWHDVNHIEQIAKILREKKTG